MEGRIRICLLVFYGRIRGSGCFARLYPDQDFFGGPDPDLDPVFFNSRIRIRVSSKGRIRFFLYVWIRFFLYSRVRISVVVRSDQDPVFLAGQKRIRYFSLGRIWFDPTPDPQPWWQYEVILCSYLLARLRFQFYCTTQTPFKISEKCRYFFPMLFFYLLSFLDVSFSFSISLILILFFSS